MSAPSRLGEPIRFGLFEFDPRSGELRKQGLKIRLQGQPVEILSMLLARPGELVTRDELQKKLWPGDTFVDFDPSLNAAMKRLRSALGDSAETPRVHRNAGPPGIPFPRPGRCSIWRSSRGSGCAAACAPRIFPSSALPAGRLGGHTCARPGCHAALP